VRRPALLLLLLCVVSFFFGLGRPALTDADEAYYAEASREMVESGDWLTPHFNYEDRWQKPVLYYWLTAVTYLVFGIGEWSARCWSALAGIGLAFSTYAAGRALTRHEEVGWLAGAMVATSYGYFALGRMALPDMPLAFFVTVTIAALFEGRWMLAAVASGLGFLVKGPLAVVLPALVFAPVWWRERLRISARQVVLAALVFAVVALPWYIAMTMTHGRAYLESFFLADNLERFATDRFNEPRSPLFYLPVLLGGLLPWTAYLVAVIWRPTRDLVARRLVLTGAQWRLLLWAGLPLLFFSLSIGKQPRYVLPILPPVAILVAHAIVQRIDAARHGVRSAARDLRAATLATAVLFALIAALIWRGRELFITVIPTARWMSIVALWGCAVALGLTARPQRVQRLIVLMPVCAAIMLAAIQFGVFAGRRPEAVEQMAALVHQARSANERVGEYGVFGRNLVFYLGFKQEVIGSHQHAADFLRLPDRVMLVVREADLPNIEAAAGIPVRRLGEVRYFNTGNIKLRSLLAPDPDTEIQRVLLVSNR